MRILILYQWGMLLQKPLAFTKYYLELIFCPSPKNIHLWRGMGVVKGLVKFKVIAAHGLIKIFS